MEKGKRTVVSGQSSVGVKCPYCKKSNMVGLASHLSLVECDHCEKQFMSGVVREIRWATMKIEGEE